MNRGISLKNLREQFGSVVDDFEPAINDLTEAGLVESSADQLCLTPRGRLLSNEVFARFLGEKIVTPTDRSECLIRSKWANAVP